VVLDQANRPAHTTGNIALQRLVLVGVRDSRDQDGTSGRDDSHSQAKDIPHSFPGDATSTRRNQSQPLGATTYTLDSTPASLDTLENATLDAARKAGFHGDALEKIGLAVREIAANAAIIHSNRLDSRKNIVATIVRTSKQIKITVSDQGAGFDPAGLPDSCSPQALLRGSGRGIYLARAFMDEFHVRTETGGASVTLIKYIRNLA
jgi:serine/threonine-protein kinase RsbW